MALLKRVINIIKAQVLNGATGTYQNQTESSFSHEQSKGTDGHRDPENDHDAALARWYANLEVPYGSNIDVVHKAWKCLLRKYHPDLYSKDASKRKVANELTQGLNRAYQELKKRLTTEPK